MGVRVQYHEAPSEQWIDILRSEYHEFRNWALKHSEKFPNEIDYKVFTLAIDHSNVDTLFEVSSPESIDELICCFLCDYLLHAQKSLQLVTESMLKIDNYRLAYVQIQEHCDKEVSDLWSFILSGRSSNKRSILDLENPVFRFCLLSEQECKLLRQNIVLQDSPATKAFVHSVEKKQNRGMLILIA